MNGVERIAQERARQISEEGYTPDHDAEHDGELVDAALCYLTPAADTVYGGGKNWTLMLGFTDVPKRWPWAARFWKPTPADRARELVKAGALIAAEIDRLAAEEGKQTCEHGHTKRDEDDTQEAKP